MYRALAAFFLLATTATAEPRVKGYDVLGVAQYCDTFLQAPRLPAMSVLMSTFGDPLPCVEKRIRLGELKLVQVDLRDATCFRNRVCPAGTPPLDDWKVLRDRAQRVQRLAKKYPNIEWWVSPWLEHDEKSEAKVRQACSEAQKGCPSCKCINSPVSGARPRGIPIELHGTKVSAFAVSGDGASIFDGDTLVSDNNKFEHFNAGADQTYAWFNEMNLRCTGEKTFTPPLQRTNRPPLELFRQAYMNMFEEEKRPAPPAACKRTRTVEQQEIVKPNAEAYCNGQQDDIRGNRPLLILKRVGRKGDVLPVLDKAGRQVASFRYYGQFEKPGYYRYYMGTGSRHKPTELHDALGGEWGFAQLGGGNCLLFNAVRRMGVYR